MEMNYHYRSNYRTPNITNQLFMNDRRTRMYNYSNKVQNRNLGMNLPYSEINPRNRDINNVMNVYPNKVKENKDIVNFDKYNENNSFNRMNKTKTNSFLNNNNQNNKKDYIFSNHKNDISKYGNYNYYEKNYFEPKYSILDKKSKINPKTEITKDKYFRNEIIDLDKKGLFNIDNNTIKNYIPNISRINNPINNEKNKDKEILSKKNINELYNVSTKIGNEIEEQFTKKELDIYQKDKLLSKYNAIGKEKIDLDINKNQLDLNNIEKHKGNIINDNKSEEEEKKDLDIKSDKDEDIYGKIENEKTKEDNKSNINRSKSTAPNKTIIAYENSKISSSLVGFNNLGSTCYMNSALQNIIHCKTFIDKINVYRNSNFLNTPNKDITNSFLKLCNSLINSKNDATRKYLSYTYSLNSISPSNFKSNFCLKHKDYMRGQHDSIEFLRTLLDDMSKEINLNQNISAYKELTTEGKSKEEQSNEYHDFFKSRENSIIVDIFYNQIINIFTCSCGFDSYSFQKLLDIPLLLPNNKYKIEFSSLIKEYFKEEELEWSTKCEKCQKPELKHLKIIKFCILNEICIFSLQRFDPILSIKNNIRVSFDEIIDLKDYCDHDLYKDNTKYRLCGTINHIGNINYGHYYTYIRIGEIWYEFNDSIVHKVPRMDYDSSSVCVLFYEKL